MMRARRCNRRQQMGETVRKSVIPLVALAMLALPLTGRATASTTGIQGAEAQPCPQEVWVGGDLSCTISYTGSKWYSGDWVALHATADNLWVNGYTPNNVDFKVRVVNAVGYHDSPWARGGTGNGLSVGGIFPTDVRGGHLIYANGQDLSVW